MRQFGLFLGMGLRTFLRERAALFWTLVMPIFFLLLFGMAFSDPKPPRVLVEDEDGGDWAGRVTNSLRAASWLATAEVLEKDADAVVRIPKGFSAGVTAKEPQFLLVTLKAGRPERTGPILATLTSVLSELNAQAAGGTRLMDLVREEAGADDRIGFRYADFLVPGLVGLNVLSMALFGIGARLTAIRSEGLLRRLWLTPARPVAFIAAKMAVTAVVATAGAVLVVGTARLIFGTPLPRSPLVFLGLVLFAVLTFSPLGLAVAARARHPHTAAMAVNLVYFPLMFLSGVYFPASLLPRALQGVMTALPLKPLVDALRMAAEGAAPAAFAGSLAVPAAWMVGALILTRGVFQWRD